MKEIGKLIELLNEYENKKTDTNIRYWDYYQNCLHYLQFGQTYSELLMISKRYRFIKWLVENDKIDRSWFNYRNIYMSDYGSSDDIFLAYEKGEQGILYDFECEDTLLMLLSIEDEPIRFLCEILK